ncbi:hypothetical protein COHA_005847 [Chlorella ohadii]|uniref:Uncharacterized protein n=1 Tax=Chlorella ohadii TaxID=2649997 RepID=A0AAD5DNY4_9CHLO|nr:hypothetical protein COHA_005847 [Chlorella ohadii]
MARPTGLGVACALAVFIALGAAGTTVGITAAWAANNLPSASDMPWWMITLLATGGVACICAILAILLQLCVPRSSMAVTAVLAGLGVHIGMLVSYTVYLCKYFTIAEGWCYMTSCYTGYGGLLSGGPVSTLGSTQFNAFDSWSSWTTQMKVLYIFGCAIGVFFWIIALPCAIGSVATAKRRTAAEAQAAAAVMNVDALVAKPGVAPEARQEQFYVGV